MSAAPYGTWTSPITAQKLTKGSVRQTEIVVDSVTATVYHVESRPSEGGRCVLVESNTGRDIVGAQWNVRTGVQEYGGAPAIVHAGVAYFSHFADSRVYSVEVEEGSQPRAVTPENEALRYADMHVHPEHSHLLVSVLQNHSDTSSPTSVVNTLCIINSKSQSISPLVSGADFYASPRFSPDGSRIVWQQWYLPDMPWQGAEVFVADVVSEADDTLAIRNATHVAGQVKTNSVSYPSWATNTTVLFTSDKTGYQNPWKYGRKAVPVFPEPLDEDFGEPAWILGRSSYAVIEDGKRALFAALRDGRSALYIVDIATGTRRVVENPYVSIQSMRPVGADTVVFIGERVDAPAELVVCTVGPDSSACFSSLVSKPAAVPDFPTELLSVAQPMTLKGPDSHPVHVVYFPPNNPAYSGTSISGEKPPCILNVHGGPTHFLGHALDMTTQYYTSRGWAWLNVNFGGSSGYGRAYIERLAGQWGVVDVGDCIQAAKIIAHAPYNLVDPARIVIRGGSAGGFTALGAVSTAPDAAAASRAPFAFAAATSSYGISDIRRLVVDTHKFEAGYADGLLGGSIAEIPEVYAERSPVTHAERIVVPLLILQGDLDRVVPKEQAEAIFESIKRRGGVVEYHLYPGEGHGWRKEENMIDALERERAFYETVLKIK
ncbi:Alpha/Beta hydrolase protein [Mycena pura]|uniref:Alpha/Beta hydrolase protein n=1 Tax=Mycena pura TaxID=153505 RepID=A0AAD6YBT6_9AGAR|nr:Alpha/Beta hydrolase protein [Mycena pura]